MEAAMMEVTPEVSTCYSDDPDLPLIEACANGDVAAFDELVRRYDCKLLRIARQVTNNLEDAEEAVQEAFLKVHQKLHQFQRNSKFSTWLIRITLNESFMKLRRRRFSEVPLDYEDPNGEVVPKDLTDWSPNPEQMCSRTELQGILRSALEALPPALRVVFVLRDIEEISIKETAAILDLNPAAVKARLYRARLRLREKLSKHFRQPST
jgi:RNA polymerase sigma-70 factor, ECF subfamily